MLLAPQKTYSPNHRSMLNVKHSNPRSCIKFFRVRGKGFFGPVHAACATRTFTSSPFLCAPFLYPVPQPSPNGRTCQLAQGPRSCGLSHWLPAACAARRLLRFLLQSMVPCDAAQPETTRTARNPKPSTFPWYCSAHICSVECIQVHPKLNRKRTILTK